MMTLVLLTGLALVSVNMFIPSLAHMAADFEVDYSLMSLSVAGYLAMTGVLQIILGPLSDRFGRRPVLLVGLVVFVLASVGCWLAQDFWLFLVFRLLQGAIIAGSALSRAVVRDMLEPRAAASMMGYISSAMAIAPMLGPMLGGVLDEWFGWRANFAAFTLFGVGLLLVCWADLGETNQNKSETFGKQFRSYPELVRSRRFWGYSACSAFSVGSFYAFLAGVPMVAMTVLDLSPATLGLCVGLITSGFFIGTFISGRIAARFELTTMMLAGRVVACAGPVVGLGLFALGYLNVVTLFGSVIFVGMGNGLTLPSAGVGALSVRPHLAGSASGLSGALTVGGGAVVTSVSGAVVAGAWAAHILLGLMLASAFVGLLAALAVYLLDRIEGPLSA
jgi:Bcr/CflA subfamily drug resistance transporter